MTSTQGNCEGGIQSSLLFLYACNFGEPMSGPHPLRYSVQVIHRHPRGFRIISAAVVFVPDAQKAYARSGFSLLLLLFVVAFFTLTDRASTIPSNTRGCQSGTWSAGQKNIRGASTKLQ